MKAYQKLTLLSILVGQSISQASYPVKAGDSLSQIAKDQYGDFSKWREIWKLNQNISDPNLIFPGQHLRLLSSDAIDLYASNTVTEPSTGAPPVYRRSKKSTEWEILPVQEWEKFIFQTDPSVDPDGFDRRSRVAVRVADQTTAQMTIASDRIPILGEISNARSEYERLFLGEQVFIKADEQLQVGTVYSITTGPQKIVSIRDGRVGFAYDLTGKIKIIGVRDGTFIATITALYLPIKRHQLLVPEIPTYQFPTAIPAPSGLQAVILTPKASEEELLGEQRIVILDIGTDDGAKPGMIFRHFLHNDPSTKESISTKDFLIETELQILSAQSKFSIAIILKSRSIAHFGDDVVGVTDLKDFQTNQGMQSVIQDSTTSPTVDTLDQMDSTDGLGEKENHDLRQLEKWSKPNVESTLAAPTSADDEIQKVDTRSDRKSVDIGSESAPNDGTTKPMTAPPADPNASPAPQPTPEPAKRDTEPVVPSPLMEPSTDQVVPPAANSEPPPTSLESSAPPPTTPPPMLEGAPVPANP